MDETSQAERMVRERDESGKYSETVTPDAVLSVFDEVEGPVITSTDVSEALDCTTEAARRKLKQLVNDGTLARRKSGRTVLYWRLIEERDGQEGDGDE